MVVGRGVVGVFNGVSFHAGLREVSRASAPRANAAGVCLSSLAVVLCVSVCRTQPSATRCVTHRAAGYRIPRLSREGVLQAALDTPSQPRERGFLPAVRAHPIASPLCSDRGSLVVSA